DCGRILSSEDQRRFGIDFSDNRYGDVIFLMNTGVLIKPSFMGKRAPDGMHGFDPEKDKYASAIFLSNHRPQQPVRTLIDVHSILSNWIDSARGGAHGSRQADRGRTVLERDGARRRRRSSPGAGSRFGSREVSQLPGLSPTIVGRLRRRLEEF